MIPLGDGLEAPADVVITTQLAGYGIHPKQLAFVMWVSGDSITTPSCTLLKRAKADRSLPIGLPCASLEASCGTIAVCCSLGPGMSDNQHDDVDSLGEFCLPQAMTPKPVMACPAGTPV